MSVMQLRIIVNKHACFLRYKISKPFSINRTRNVTNKQTNKQNIYFPHS